MCVFILLARIIYRAIICARRVAQIARRSVCYTFHKRNLFYKQIQNRLAGARSLSSAYCARLFGDYIAAQIGAVRFCKVYMCAAVPILLDYIYIYKLSHISIRVCTMCVKVCLWGETREKMQSVFQQVCLQFTIMSARDLVIIVFGRGQR